jgi:hypothetical protein
MKKSVRVLGAITVGLGVAFAAVGAVAWGFTASQLSAQSITVPNFPEAGTNGSDSIFRGFAGDTVNNPLAAMAQAEIIGIHQQNGAVAAISANSDLLSSLGVTGIDNPADTKWTFAALGQLNTAVNTALGDEATSEADLPALQQLGGLRTTANQAAGLQSSLFTSVLAFGVSLFAVGVGALSVVVGIALIKVAGKKDDAAVEVPAVA